MNSRLAELILCIVNPWAGDFLLLCRNYTLNINKKLNPS